jgi:hypothetical protein
VVDRSRSSFQDAGAEVFDYGNSIRDEARLGGYDRAFEFPGFVPAYIRPLFCEGKGPFRWAALSGDPKDIYATTRCPTCRSGSSWTTGPGEDQLPGPAGPGHVVERVLRGQRPPGRL